MTERKSLAVISVITVIACLFTLFAGLSGYSACKGSISDEKESLDSLSELTDKFDAAVDLLDKDAEKYQEIRKAYEEAIKEAKSIKSVAEAEEIFLTKAETEYQPHFTELDKPEESDFDELEEEPTTGPGQEAPNMENIRKLMEMLSSRKAVSLADLVKSYKIFPVKKMSDNKREKNSMWHEQIFRATWNFKRRSMNSQEVQQGETRTSSV